MAGDRAVRGFVFELAVRAAEHRSHHRERAESRGYHVAHDVAVIILQSPDKAALASDNARDRIVDQRVEVGEAELIELLFIAFVIQLLEHVAEVHVVLFRNSVLAREPEILLCLDRVLETRVRERFDRRVLVVDALDYTRALKVIDRLAEGVSVLAGEY